QITFAPQLTYGTYTVQIGPEIQDFSGNRMNQDGDGNNGETPDDIYTAQFQVTGLQVIPPAQPSDPVPFNPGLQFIDVTFSLPVEGSTFTAADITLTGPNGLIMLNGDPAPQNAADTVWRINFPTQQTVGTYHLTLGPNIQSTNGAFMDQNANQMFLEPQPY